MSVVISKDQICSALLFFAATYPVIAYLFSDSTCGKQKKNKSVKYSLSILCVFAAVKFFYDSSVMSPNYYSILQIGRHSSALDIRRSYKQLSKELHPDKNMFSANAEDIHVQYIQLKLAYDVLMDESTRDMYSRFGAMESYEFDPRKDELKLLSDIAMNYLFWMVVVYVMTLPVSSRSCRTWIAILGESTLRVACSSFTL